jgi:hypothetical protein
MQSVTLFRIFHMKIIPENLAPKDSFQTKLVHNSVSSGNCSVQSEGVTSKTFQHNFFWNRNREKQVSNNLWSDQDSLSTNNWDLRGLSWCVYQHTIQHWRTSYPSTKSNGANRRTKSAALFQSQTCPCPSTTPMQAAPIYADLCPTLSLPVTFSHKIKVLRFLWLYCQIWRAWGNSTMER